MSHAVPNEATTPKPHRVAYALATGLGAGLIPIGPGTMGSVEGVAIFLAVNALSLGQRSLVFALMVLNVLVFTIGVWAANKACSIARLEDPQVVVIDEVSGQLFALTPLVFFPPVSLIAIGAGFALFRLFDIFKPYPIRKLERLHGGLGVMADDALAGIYAAALLCVGRLFNLI